MAQAKNFKFCILVGYMKYRPLDDILSKWARCGHVTYFKFCEPQSSGTTEATVGTHVRHIKLIVLG